MDGTSADFGFNFDIPVVDSTFGDLGGNGGDDDGSDRARPPSPQSDLGVPPSRSNTPELAPGADVGEGAGGVGGGDASGQAQHSASLTAQVKPSPCLDP